MLNGIADGLAVVALILFLAMANMIVNKIIEVLEQIKK